MTTNGINTTRINGMNISIPKTDSTINNNDKNVKLKESNPLNFINDAGNILTKTASNVAHAVIDFVSPNDKNQTVIKNIEKSSKTDVPHKNVIGAYFNKVETHQVKDNIGIKGNAKLPIISFDGSRYDTKHGYLDIPSVYMGGNANGKELDAGLSWDKVYIFKDNKKVLTYTDSPNGTDGGDSSKRYIKVEDKNKNIIYQDCSIPPKIVAGGKSGISVSDFEKKIKMNYAFRPFWRTTNDDSYQISIGDKIKVNSGKTPNTINLNGKEFAVKTDSKGMYYETNENNKNVRHPLVKDKDTNGKDALFMAANKWHNPLIDGDSKTPPNVYFYPGQNINMSITTGKNGDVRMTINSSDGKTKFSQDFKADGFGKGSSQSFKAVNSIDQFTVINGQRKGLEGLKSGVLPTKTAVNDATWELSSMKKKNITEPLTNKNSIEFRGSDTLKEDFNRAQTKKGNGTVRELDIDPNENAHQKIIDLKSLAIHKIKNNMKYFINNLKPEFSADKVKSKTQNYRRYQVNTQFDFILQELIKNKINITEEEKERIKAELTNKTLKSII